MQVNVLGAFPTVALCPLALPPIALRLFQNRPKTNGHRVHRLYAIGFSLLAKLETGAIPHG